MSKFEPAALPGEILTPADTTDQEPKLNRNSIFLTETLVKESDGITTSKIRLPSWNNPGRPKNPKVGTIGFNFQTSQLEIWNGSSWIKLKMNKI